MEKDGNARTLSSVIKAFDVVEALWETDGAGISELAERLDLPTSTVHAHVSTLYEEGYVVKDDGIYRLSLRFLTYGEHAKQMEPVYHAATGPLAELADRTGEFVLCATEQNGLATVLDFCEGERSVGTDITEGYNMYLHASAAGKAILAHLPEERVDAIIDRWGLPEFTEETITTREAIYEELETVREEGVGVANGDYQPGLQGVAAPILDNDGGVHGAISIRGPKRSLETDWTRAELHDELSSTTNTAEVNLMILS